MTTQYNKLNFESTRKMEIRSKKLLASPTAKLYAEGILQRKEVRRLSLIYPLSNPSRHSSDKHI